MTTATMPVFQLLMITIFVMLNRSLEDGWKNAGFIHRMAAVLWVVGHLPTNSILGVGRERRTAMGIERNGAAGQTATSFFATLTLSVRQRAFVC